MKYTFETQLNPKTLNDIKEIAKKIFAHFEEEKLIQKLTLHPKFLIVLSYEQENLVGFKIGYEQNADTFYSWLGGVLPEKRGQAIASTLMNMQHEWCKTNHYKFIETKSREIFPEMIALNLKFGFQNMGLIQNTEKILFKKIL